MFVHGLNNLHQDKSPPKVAPTGFSAAELLSALQWEKAGPGEEEEEETGEREAQQENPGKTSFL